MPNVTINFRSSHRNFDRAVESFGETYNLTPASWQYSSFNVEVPSTEIVNVMANLCHLAESWTVKATRSREAWHKCCETREWHPVSVLRRTPYGEWMHIDHFWDYYSICDDCCNTVPRDEVSYHESDDCNYCTSCMYPSEEGVQYFNGPRKEFSTDNSFGSCRYFGIELETNTGRCATSFAFDGKGDGSIDGTEFVSHKLRGDEGMAELKAFMESGEGISVGRNCGTHIHMDASNLTRDELYSVYAAYCVTEDYWGSKVDERLGSRYAANFYRDGFAVICECYNRGDSFRTLVGRESGYQWMRGCAYLRHKTLENRLHHGSWNFAELSRWIILNLRFMRFARQLRLEPNETRESFRAKVESAIALAERHDAVLAMDVVA